MIFIYSQYLCLDHVYVVLVCMSRKKKKLIMVGKENILYFLAILFSLLFLCVEHHLFIFEFDK